MARPIIQFHYTLPCDGRYVQVYARSLAEAVRALKKAGHTTTELDFRRFASRGSGEIADLKDRVVLGDSVGINEVIAAFKHRKTRERI